MKTIFRSDDGTEFDSHIACEEHETKQRNPLALLAIEDHAVLTRSDIIEIRVGRLASCMTISFSDYSIIELTHHRVRVYNADGTECLAQFDRIKDQDIGD